MGFSGDFLQDFPAKELIRIYRSPELLAHLSGKKGLGLAWHRLGMVKTLEIGGMIFIYFYLLFYFQCIAHITVSHYLQQFYIVLYLTGAGRSKHNMII